MIASILQLWLPICHLGPFCANHNCKIDAAGVGGRPRSQQPDADGELHRNRLQCPGHMSHCIPRNHPNITPATEPPLNEEVPPVTRATENEPVSDARADWENRIALRTDERDSAVEDSVAGALLPDLPAPTGLRAEPGVGHVLLRWEPVAGAVGYLMHRATDSGSAADATDSGSAAGNFVAIDHLGGDVLSVPDTWYVDTTGKPGETYTYAVAAVPEVTAVGPLSESVTAAAIVAAETVPTVQLAVDAAVAADDRQRAPLAAALQGPLGRS
jgi:hypothetical protein